MRITSEAGYRLARARLRELARKEDACRARANDWTLPYEARLLATADAKKFEDARQKVSQELLDYIPHWRGSESL